MQISGQKSIDLLPGLTGQWCIQAIEIMSAGRIFINLVLELLAFRLKGLNQVLYFQVIYVLVIRVGVN